VSIKGQVVDTETAQEFMKQVLENATLRELGDIVGELERKADRFQELLVPAHLPELTAEELLGLLRHIFATRRRAQVVLDALGVEFFRTALPDLLYGEGAPAFRFQTFVDAMEANFQPEDNNLELPANLRCDLAAELLHFNDPYTHWLWARWMWDAKPATGALPLVVETDFDLNGETLGEIYNKVGIATAFVKATGEAAGFSKLNNSPFDIDVFYACVYAIYMYTTLRMRMTQEFNKVVPQLPELTRRLLGVWRFNL
jgi:hypothetical protein